MGLKDRVVDAPIDGIARILMEYDLTDGEVRSISRDIQNFAKEYESDRLKDAVRDAVDLIDALLADQPMLAGKLVGSTTVGNRRAEIHGVLLKMEQR